MDQATYARWWSLHARAARGENLDTAERAAYEAGLANLDADEKIAWGDDAVTLLRQLRSEVERLEQAHAQLQARSQQLDRQIWTLEGAYMSLTGFELSSQGYATSPV